VTRVGTASRGLALLAGAAMVAYALGLAWFVQATTRPAELPPAHADGIVALTGGPGRIDLALRLLANGHADRLLLSGVGGGTELATLGRLAGIDVTTMAPRITLGRDAASTRGNAAETASWASQNHIGSLIVVTAGYHMPRAMVELRRTLPNAHLFPLPVQPQTATPSEHASGIKLEAEEFTKFLVALSGLSAWAPHRDAPTPLHPTPSADE
jgi:uncharacterized SAM-binding protein YcdF (DUF218 family)